VIDELQTVYRRSANGRIEAIELKRDEAEFAVARWPFAWSLTPNGHARWPWPPADRGASVVANLPEWSPKP
jgi:hypothetical protein